ncbi:MAG TPA: cytochrome P450 [Burkholderiales bacterium]|nr:cytochrome P450 [Burkholderiales bacterium]
MQLRKIRELPGPRGLPILGNLLQLRNSRLHLTAEKWSRTYGEYFRFRIGPRLFLAVANPETIAAVLRDRPDGFHRGERLSAIADDMGFNGVFSANGDAWRRQRSMVMASFDPRHIKAYFPALARVTERFERHWRRAAAAGETIDLQADLMRYTVDVTSGLAFGVDINTLESDEEVIQTHLDQVFPALFRRLMAPFPYWTWLRNRNLDRHLDALQRAVQDFIGQARRRMQANPALRDTPTNLIEAMIAARDNPGSGVTDADVAGNVLTMLLAGEDTTANTLAWMIYLLYRHPDALRRAREEVLGRDLHNYESMTALPFVDACINETMRLKPVAPIIILQPTRDTVVAGIEVPKGTILMCLMRAGAIDERRFPDARAFDPARWLSGATAASPKRVSMPFGAGPRLCPGRYLAILEMKMVMTMLLDNFEIEHVGTPDGGEAREHLAFTMYPEELRLKLKATKARA